MIRRWQILLLSSMLSAFMIPRVDSARLNHIQKYEANVAGHTTMPSSSKMLSRRHAWSPWELSYESLPCSDIKPLAMDGLKTNWPTCWNKAVADAKVFAQKGNCKVCDVKFAGSKPESLQTMFSTECSATVTCAANRIGSKACYETEGKLNAVIGLNDEVSARDAYNDMACLPCPKGCQECHAVSGRAFGVQRKFKCIVRAKSSMQRQVCELPEGIQCGKCEPRASKKGLPYFKSKCDFPAFFVPEPGTVQKMDVEAGSESYTIKLKAGEDKTALPVVIDYLSTQKETYACSTGYGSGCATCMERSQRMTTNHCASCNVGHSLSGTTCQKILGDPLGTLPTVNDDINMKKAEELPSKTEADDEQPLDPAGETVLDAPIGTLPAVIDDINMKKEEESPSKTEADDEQPLDPAGETVLDDAEPGSRVSPVDDINMKKEEEFPSKTEADDEQPLDPAGETVLGDAEPGLRVSTVDGGSVGDAGQESPSTLPGNSERFDGDERPPARPPLSLPLSSSTSDRSFGGNSAPPRPTEAGSWTFGFKVLNFRASRITDATVIIDAAGLGKRKCTTDENGLFCIRMPASVDEVTWTTTAPTCSADKGSKLKSKYCKGSDICVMQSVLNGMKGGCNGAGTAKHIYRESREDDNFCANMLKNHEDYGCSPVTDAEIAAQTLVSMRSGDNRPDQPGALKFDTDAPFDPDEVLDEFPPAELDEEEEDVPPPDLDEDAEDPSLNDEDTVF